MTRSLIFIRYMQYYLYIRIVGNATNYIHFQYRLFFRFVFLLIYLALNMDFFLPFLLCSRLVFVTEITDEIGIGFSWAKKNIDQRGKHMPDVALTFLIYGVCTSSFIGSFFHLALRAMLLLVFPY